jgi:hypothetical protein
MPIKEIIWTRRYDSECIIWRIQWKVLEQLQPNDLSTKILLEYNKLLVKMIQSRNCLLPIRDGLTSRVL